jgi:hypothetical protein
LKALVVGLGRMGGFHRRALADLGYDVTTADAAGHADYAFPPCRSFDVTCIATPIEHLSACAAERLPLTRHLLVEKPLAPTAAEARAFADLIAEQRVAVGYVERFNPQVRALASAGASEAMFVRWNVRRTPDPALDLTSHDIDLARWLGLHATYDTRSGAPQVKRQVITDRGAFDLCAHDTSPLHAQWHAFLSGRPDYATAEDAVAVLDYLEQLNPAPGAMTPPEVPA